MQIIPLSNAQAKWIEGTTFINYSISESRVGSFNSFLPKEIYSLQLHMIVNSPNCNILFSATHTHKLFDL